jgi:beta-lactamase class A
MDLIRAEAERAPPAAGPAFVFVEGAGPRTPGTTLAVLRPRSMRSRVTIEVVDLRSPGVVDRISASPPERTFIVAAPRHDRAPWRDPFETRLETRLRVFRPGGEWAATLFRFRSPVDLSGSPPGSAKPPTRTDGLHSPERIMISPARAVRLTSLLSLAAIQPPVTPPASHPVATAPAASFPARRAQAQAVLDEAARSPGVEISVAYRALDGSEEWFVDADRLFHAASTMKVAVMVELFRQAEARDLSLGDPLIVRNEFKSVVDGSPYRMDLGADSDDEVYKADGQAMTLEALNFQMITVSSNFATNLLIDRLGVANIRRTVESLGAVGHEVRRGVEDQKAFDRGIINETSARGLLILLEAIARGRAASKSASDRMIDVLSRQKFREGIPKLLPAGTRVAHKTGTITKVHHDAGIVFGAKPYVLVVLTRGFATEKESDAVIARVAYGLHR